MNDQQLLRYSRHILLEDIGIEEQERLLHGSVLIVGLGGKLISANVPDTNVMRNTLTRDSSCPVCAHVSGGESAAGIAQNQHRQISVQIELVCNLK
jgi:hypothetical protein